ncbi:MAG: ECF transporter S component [candidate division KSB1 bacterium]|nr:ECF transporter S component [candidate division KSB1 bacterium]
MRFSLSKQPLLLAAVLSALCVVTGYLFLFVPNVELITAMVFLSGAVMGPAYGLLIGGVSELIFSLFNPYGTPMPTLLAAQVLSFCCIGVCGGTFGRLQFRSSTIRVGVFAALGFFLTLIYDLLTTLSFALFAAGGDWQKTAAFFLQGSPFYLIHLGSNAVVFALLIPPALTQIRALDFMRRKFA